VIIGETNLESLHDFNDPGTAEAFRFTAKASASLTRMTVYVDSGATGHLTVGLYSTSAGHPHTLLTSATIASPSAGAWNTVNVPSVSLLAGTDYWIAFVSPNGTARFVDAGGQGASTCSSENDADTALAALPATWTTSRTFQDCPVSAYGES
jgi:hypothetical protein